MLAPDAIIHHSRRRTDERLRQNLQDQRQRHRTGSSGELEKQAVDGERVKPVADLAYNLRGPETPEIAVVAQQPHIGAERD